MNGRVSLPLALSRLTVWESQLVQHVLGRTDVELSGDAGPARAGGAPPIAVSRSRHAGLSFWGPDELPLPDSRPVGWLYVPPEVLDMVGEATRVARAREAAGTAEVEDVLAQWAASGELDRRLAELADWVERVETVLVLIGRDVFSKSDAGTNTLTRDGLLRSLTKNPPHSWRPSERIFVVLAHCLFVTGRSVRFEEFNGRQLTAHAVRDFLADRHALYSAATGRAPRNVHGVPLFALAAEVRELLAEVDRSPVMRYRRINGLTFVKNEHLMDFPLPRDPETMPALLARYGKECLGVDPTGDVRADLRAMTLAAVALDAARPGQEAVPRAAAIPEPAVSPEAAAIPEPAAIPENPAARPAPGPGGVGELLSAIVLSAVTATGSDYGMSSSVRDLTSLRGAEPGSPDGVLELKKGDFFCCCLPHPVRMAPLGEEAVPILWRAAQRMMYNRWHFAPGEYDRTVIPRSRHYFFPPQIPDIAEHGEHHHGGHIASRVRFTIRAPGAQVWLPPFTVFGHGYRGCYDIRLVRMEGPAYTLTELVEAVRHCSLVDELWRTLAEDARDAAAPPRPVTGFDRAWYESRGWERLRPTLLATQAPAGAVLA